jgi:membrane protease YdiL (CAAX protease family)
MEFHYRGFVQFGLRESFGEINALWVQLAMSVLILASKPMGEAFGAIWCGLLWGVLAFRNRSLLSGLLQRFVMGMSLDFFLCFGHRLT